MMLQGKQVLMLLLIFQFLFLLTEDLYWIHVILEVIWIYTEKFWLYTSWRNYRKELNPFCSFTLDREIVAHLYPWKGRKTMPRPTL